MMRSKIFNNLMGIQKQMLKLIGEMNSLSDPLALEEAIDESWHPHCDVFQTDTQWIVVVELAGVQKEEISISLSADYLKLSGNRRSASPSDIPTHYQNMEIETGSFARIVYFPQLKIDKENPTVTLSDGILRIAFDLSPTIERLIPID